MLSKDRDALKVGQNQSALKIRELSAKLAASEQNATELEAQLKQEERTSNAALRAKGEADAASKAKIRDLEAQLKKTQATLGDLEPKHAALKNEHKKFIDEAREVNSKLAADLKAAEAATVTAKDKTSALEQRVQELEGCKKQSEQTAQETTARIDFLQRELEDGLNTYNQVVNEKNNIQEQGNNLYAAHEELKIECEELKARLNNQTGTSSSEDPNSMDIDRNSASRNPEITDYTRSESSGADFLGIDYPASLELISGCVLGNDKLQVIDNAMRMSEASLLPRDIEREMLAVGINHSILVVTPRFLDEKPVTVICESTPENFRFLTTELLLPYRDPRSQTEPTREHNKEYGIMCGLAKHPDLLIEAASRARIFSTHPSDRTMHQFRNNIHAVCGKPNDWSQRVPFPEYHKRKFPGLWEEAVQRLAVFKDFKISAYAFATNNDSEDTFARWLPRVLKGVPEGEAMHRVAPAAALSNHDDGLDDQVPDAQDSGPNAVDFVDRHQRNDQARHQPQYQNERNTAPQPQRHQFDDAPRAPRALTDAPRAPVAASSATPRTQLDTSRAPVSATTDRRNNVPQPQRHPFDVPRVTRAALDATRAPVPAAADKRHDSPEPERHPFDVPRAARAQLNAPRNPAAPPAAALTTRVGDHRVPVPAAADTSDLESYVDSEREDSDSDAQHAPARTTSAREQKAPSNYPTTDPYAAERAANAARRANNEPQRDRNSRFDRPPPAVHDRRYPGPQRDDRPRQEDRRHTRFDEERRDPPTGPRQQYRDQYRPQQHGNGYGYGGRGGWNRGGRGRGGGYSSDNNGYQGESRAAGKMPESRRDRSPPGNQGGGSRRMQLPSERSVE